MTKKPEEAAAPAPSATPASAATELLTPAEWAQRKGLIGKLDPVRPWEPPRKKALYAAAEVLHGWAQDAHNYQGEGQELRISESDFDAALVAAGKYPAAPAHEAACGRDFKDRAKPVVCPHTGATLGTGKIAIAPKKPKEAVKTDG